MPMDATAPYFVPKEPGRGRAIALAAAVHLALLAFLWIGVRWQNDTPVAVEAEVWSPQQREAAPLPPPPPPAPKVSPRPVPAPVEQPVTRPVEKIAPVMPSPDIALAQEKKRRLALKKQQDEEAREEKRIRQVEQAKEKNLARLEEEKRLKKDAAEKDKRDEQKRNNEKLARAEQKKIEADKKRALDDADNKRLAKARDDEMRHISGVVGSGGAGDAPKSQGGRADPSYSQKVGARIKSNTVFNVSDDLEGNPAVEYAVELLPDGSLRGIRKLKSSGVPGFDEAVRRAIEKSAPFPADKSGIAPSGFTMSHKPKD